MNWKWLRALPRSKQGWKANVAFLIVFGFSAVAAAVTLERSHEAARESHRDEFLDESSVRHARMLQQLDKHRRLLASTTAYFRLSERVEPAEFRRFGLDLVEQRDRVTLCWVSSDETQRMATVPDGDHSPCRLFDFLEPSTVLGDPPTIVLSEFTADRSGQQGFASVVFDAKLIALGDPAVSAAEFFVANDTLQNRTLTYSLGDGEIAHTNIEEEQTDTKYFELMQFGDVGFFYVTQPSTQVDRWSRNRTLLFVVILSLGFVAAVYFRSQILQKERIVREVELRTDELSQFAYRTSHDLRAPLVTVGRLCRAIQEDLDRGDHEFLRADVERIAVQVSRLDQLVGDIFVLTRADLGEHAVESVDVGQLLDRIEQHLDHTYSGHGVTVKRKIAVGEPLELPRARVEQVLENLLSNSIKYAHQGRSEPPFVSVRVSRNGGGLRVVVEDNGIGIPEDHQHRAFRMFERFHPQTAKTGSGLGLSIVKKHVDRLDGTIELSSDERTGTTITIGIPNVPSRTRPDGNALESPSRA